MDLIQAIQERHAVRSYTSAPIEGAIEAQLRQTIDECNRDGRLHIQLCLNEPGIFTGGMARYGSFKNVRNFIALVGKKTPDLQEKCGYYGEKIVLRAQQLGLNTCWSAMTYDKSKSKSAASVWSGEKLVLVIAIGYGTGPGRPHTSKPLSQLCRPRSPLPDWFKKGVWAASLAPTGLNQQQFLLTLRGNTVLAQALGGFYSKVDLGIVKYHFEVGAAEGYWHWGH